MKDQNITKFQYRILSAIKRLGSPTKHDIYNKFSGGRAMSAITSSLNTMKKRGWVVSALNEDNLLDYSMTDVGKFVHESVRSKTVKYNSSGTKFTKIGLCDKCRKNIEELTRYRVSVTSEGENIFEYWCRGCLCPDDDLCVERELEIRRGNYLRTEEDFETMSVGDIKAIKKSLKKHGKPANVDFGRI